MKEEETRSAIDVALKMAGAQSFIGLSSSVSTGTAPLSKLLEIELQNREIVHGFAARYLGEKTSGLYGHQLAFFEALSSSPSAIQMLTSETGSGKSLCLWSWIISILGSGPSMEDGTALALFPYKALLYNQAFRLADLSDSNSVCRLTEKNLRDHGYSLKKELKKIGFPSEQIAKSCEDGIPYAGTIVLPGGVSIPWVVWEGSKAQFGQEPTLSDFIAKKPAFEKARVRLATLDKAHSNLIRDAAGVPKPEKRLRDYLINIRAIAIDEAHMYQGVIGAHAHWFLERIDLVRRHILNRPDRPLYFLSSATIDDPAMFANRLLPESESKNSIQVTPSGTESSIVDTYNVGHGLNVLSDQRQRFLIPYTSTQEQQTGGDSVSVRYLSSLTANDPNAIYFCAYISEGAEVCRRLMELSLTGRVVVEYNANGAPAERRSIEKLLSASNGFGTTIVATSAMELGIDFPGLDICCMHNPPDDFKVFMQRIGRVGRRPGSPGLILFCADDALPSAIHDDPSLLLNRPPTPTLIPLELDLIRFQHLCRLSQDVKQQSGIRDAKWAKSVFKTADLRDANLKTLAKDMKINPMLTTDLRWMSRVRGQKAGEIEFIYKDSVIVEMSQVDALRRCPPGSYLLRHGRCYQVPFWVPRALAEQSGNGAGAIRVKVVQVQRGQSSSYGLIDIQTRTNIRGQPKNSWRFGSATVTQTLFAVRTLRAPKGEKAYRKYDIKHENTPRLEYDTYIARLLLGANIPAKGIFPEDVNMAIRHFIPMTLGIPVQEVVASVECDVDDGGRCVGGITGLRIIDSAPGGTGVSRYIINHTKALSSALQMCAKRLKKSSLGSRLHECSPEEVECIRSAARALASGVLVEESDEL